MTGKNTFIALLICIIAIPGCKRASRLDSTLEECERLAAQNPDSVMRVLDELQRTTASMDEHDQKRFLLTKLAVQNATDRPFMELDTIKDLSEHYQKNGTPKDRLTISYLMGRAYMKRKELRQAYLAFQRCLKDSVSTDDQEYNTLLSKTHIQLSGIYNGRHMADEEMEELHKAIYMAQKAGNDTLALLCKTYLFSPYKAKNDTAMVIKILENACSEMRAKGMIRQSAGHQTALMNAYIKVKDYDNARKSMEIFERESGFFDEHGNIIRGREIFYYKKGLLMLGIGKRDSAEFFFRKLLANAQNPSNVEAANKGLLELYKVLNIPDSIYKYSLSYCNANDSSCYKAVANTTNEWAESDAKEMVDKEATPSLTMGLPTWAFLLAASMPLLFMLLHYILRKQGKPMACEGTPSHVDQHKDCTCLTCNSDNVQEVHAVSMPTSAHESESDFTTLLQYAHECASNCILAHDAMSAAHWLTLESYTQRHFPIFYEHVSKHKLSPNEMHTAILTKLRFSSQEIQNLINIRGNSFTNLKMRAGKKLFNSVSSKSFTRNIAEYGEPYIE